LSLVATIIAAYAAIVATAALIWQVYSWWHRRAAHLEVTVRIAVMMPPEGILHVVSIAAINRSEYRVRVRAFGLDFQDGRAATFQQYAPVEGATLPGEIEHHDSAEGFIHVANVQKAGIDLYEPITAWVRLATGDVVRSKATRLRERRG
jgi:hypothetical protein